MGQFFTAVRVLFLTTMAKEKEFFIYSNALKKRKGGDAKVNTQGLLSP